MIFLLLMAVAGVIASQHLTWIFVTTVGIVILPIYVGAMIVSGTSALKALWFGILGFTILQASYVSAGYAVEALRSRSAPWRMKGAAFQAIRQAKKRRQTTWPLIGGWLPLLASYDPPCRADGSPWNGVDDPGYRTTVLAVGWFGRAFSIVVAPPKRVKTPLEEQTISEMDRRIAQERERSKIED